MPNHGLLFSRRRFKKTFTIHVIHTLNFAFLLRKVMVKWFLRSYKCEKSRDRQTDTKENVNREAFIHQCNVSRM